MRVLALAVALLLLTARLTAAQERWREPSDEIRPFVGVYAPVGAQQSDFKSATMLGVQLAVELTNHFHGVANLSWTHGHTQLFTEDLTHIWQYDGGLEFNAVRGMGWGWYFRPFIGAGVGGRTYDYTDPLAKNTSCVAGYGTIGVEIQRSVVAFRAETRDYLSCFESPTSGERSTRNDLGLTLGLAYHIR